MREIFKAKSSVLPHQVGGITDLRLSVQGRLGSSGLWGKSWGWRVRGTNIKEEDEDRLLLWYNSHRSGYCKSAKWCVL